jgi:hypothetical protein
VKKVPVLFSFLETRSVSFTCFKRRGSPTPNKDDWYYEELETSEIALVLEATSSAVVQLHISALGRLKARLADAEKTGCRSPS